MTLKKLKKRNPNITEFNVSVNEEDVKIANERIKQYHRNKGEIAAGDIVQFTTPYGEKRERAFIEDCRDEGHISVCESGSKWCTSNKKYLSVSGGSFFTLKKDNLEYVGRTKVNLTTWGHFGACANGSISFPVTVNIWKEKINKN